MYLKKKMNTNLTYVIIYSASFKDGLLFELHRKQDVNSITYLRLFHVLWVRTLTHTLSF